MVLRRMDGNYLIHEGPSRVAKYEIEMWSQKSPTSSMTKFDKQTTPLVNMNLNRCTIANTTTSFIQFERTADHLEFIKLLDRCKFNGIKLKVMSFGFTNSDYQECGKAMMWLDSACKLFNSQWYPTETAPGQKNRNINSPVGRKKYVRSQNYSVIR
jgi:hypothetical protein